MRMDTGAMFCLELALLRHGRTRGNEEGRYVGRTDEELSPGGRKALEGKRLFAGFHPQAVFVSPMRRCVQTAELVWPGIQEIQMEEFRETDFGLFEYKTYGELRELPSYRQWIASAGRLPAPGGEDAQAVRERIVSGFRRLAGRCQREGWERAALVAHGGAFLYLLEELAEPAGDFYGRQAGNGEGWLARWDAGRGRIVLLYREGET